MFEQTKIDERRGRPAPRIEDEDDDERPGDGKGNQRSRGKRLIVTDERNRIGEYANTGRKQRQTAEIEPRSFRRNPRRQMTLRQPRANDSERRIEQDWLASGEDRRQYVLELTASGKRMREQVLHARNGVIRSLAKVLDEKDAEDFDRIATKILAAFPDAMREKRNS